MILRVYFLHLKLRVLRQTIPFRTPYSEYNHDFYIHVLGVFILLLYWLNFRLLGIATHIVRGIAGAEEQPP